MTLPGLSAVCFWGASPALDMHELARMDPAPDASAEAAEPEPEVAAAAAAEPEADASTPLRVLVAGAGDVRHVLCTIARARRHAPKGAALRPIHIYVVEMALEPIARQLLLCNVALDCTHQLRERTGLVLELYGNAFLRDRSQEYLDSGVIDQLLTIVTQGEHRWDKLLKCGGMKCKERDDLETMIKGWRSKVPFDMKELRTKRLVEFYGHRYDHRKNLVDWDYHMKLAKMADIVHPLE